LRVLINPRDEISLRRVLNYPARGIGARTVEQLDAFATAQGVSFAQALPQAAALPNLAEHGRRAIEAFVALIARHRARVRAGTALSQVGRELVAEIDLKKELSEAADGREAGAIRYGNVEHLLRWLERREGEAGHDRRDLQAFLERVTLRGEQGPEEPTADAVVLSTLHASKGLEFDAVFLIGCVEGQLPHSRTTDPKASEAAPADVEEERRLFYVGVTRARERLYLCRPQRRMLRGQAIELTPSRFLEGLPEAQLVAYEHADAKELAFDEIAELGRSFLRRAGRA
jgi:DNA helicase-2/ATP-dependent DNA helicase PcrA